MKAVLVDSNVLLDIATRESEWERWSSLALERAANESILVINPIIYAEVSLGYDIHHDRVTDVLLAAAAQAGLRDAFVHVRELGDFSISYRVAGLLEDVQSLISARSGLRTEVLNALHGALPVTSPVCPLTKNR